MFSVQDIVTYFRADSHQGLHVASRPLLIQNELPSVSAIVKAAESAHCGTLPYKNKTKGLMLIDEL